MVRLVRPRKFPNDGALSGIGRCISVLRICDMEKRKGRQRGEIRWEKRSLLFKT